MRCRRHAMQDLGPTLKSIPKGCGTIRFELQACEADRLGLLCAYVVSAVAARLRMGVAPRRSQKHNRRGFLFGDHRESRQPARSVPLNYPLSANAMALTRGHAAPVAFNAMVSSSFDGVGCSQVMDSSNSVDCVEARNRPLTSGKPDARLEQKAHLMFNRLAFAKFGSIERLHV